MASALASIIETTMASMYNLQTSLINAQGGQNGTITPNSNQLISQIRPRFKKLWEDIRAFLQTSHTFGGDIIILQESLGRESEDDCMEFLIAIGTKSTRLLESSEKLASDAIKLRQNFSSLIPEFENTLLNSRTHIDRTNFGQYESEQLAQEACSLSSGEDLPRMFFESSYSPYLMVDISQMVMRGSGSNVPSSWNAARLTRKLKPLLKPALPPFILMVASPSTILSVRWTA
jgi:hypothetical protein